MVEPAGVEPLGVDRLNDLARSGPPLPPGLRPSVATGRLRWADHHRPVRRLPTGLAGPARAAHSGAVAVAGGLPGTGQRLLGIGLRVGAGGAGLGQHAIIGAGWPQPPAGDRALRRDTGQHADAMGGVPPAAPALVDDPGQPAPVPPVPMAGPQAHAVDDLKRRVRGTQQRAQVDGQGGGRRARMAHQPVVLGIAGQGRQKRAQRALGMALAGPRRGEARPLAVERQGDDLSEGAGPRRRPGLPGALQKVSTSTYNSVRKVSGSRMAGTPGMGAHGQHVHPTLPRPSCLSHSKRCKPARRLSPWVLPKAFTRIPYDTDSG